MASFLRSLTRSQLIKTRVSPKPGHLKEISPFYPTNPTWTCIEGLDGSLTLFNDINGKTISISSECLKTGCSCQKQISYKTSYIAHRCAVGESEKRTNEQDWGMLI